MAGRTRRQKSKGGEGVAGVKEGDGLSLEMVPPWWVGDAELVPVGPRKGQEQPCVAEKRQSRLARLCEEDQPCLWEKPICRCAPAERRSGQPALCWTSYWDEAPWPEPWKSQTWESAGRSNWRRSTKSSRVSTARDAGEGCRGGSVGLGERD